MRNLENKYPNKLRELRIKRHMTLAQVSTLLGFQSGNRICRWERGQSTPNALNLIRLSQIYEVPANEIYVST
ncbi:MAG: helix-turn-helix transcriptional regulator [Bacteroidetes bacterium]|nr:helix-turn-helix transcriptional regulator [Bacteroidota bacterium]